MPKGGYRGNYLVHRRGDRREEEERVSKKREYDINVGEIKERKKLRVEKRDRDLRTEVGRGLKEKEKSNKREDREK